MPSDEITRYPGECVSDPSAGAHAWASPENATADDSNYASCSLDPSGESEYLWADDFDFSALPTDATIVGVTMVADQRCTVGGCADVELKLVKYGLLVGDNKAALAYDWDPSFTEVARGGVSEMWGVSLSRSDVLDAGFGVAMRVVENDATYSIADVNFVRLTLYYTTPDAPDSPALVQSVTSSGRVRRFRASSFVFCAALDDSLAPVVDTWSPSVVASPVSRRSRSGVGGSVFDVAMQVASGAAETPEVMPCVVTSPVSRRTRRHATSSVLTLWPTSDAGVCDCEVGGVVVVGVGDYRVAIVDVGDVIRGVISPYRAQLVSAGDYRVVLVAECDC